MTGQTAHLPLDVRAALRDGDSPSTGEFRREIRDWLASNSHAAEADDRASGWDEVAWHRRMGAAGYLAVHWPVEYGGRGLTLAEHYTVQEELAAAGLPLMGLSILAVGLCGPTIMEWGTRQQKERLLPGIASGEDIWCQLFSEPGAGSDLSGVSTRATEDEAGGHVVTGQKVWTSLAQHARYGMLLARTDPAQDRSRGLTWMVAPLRNQSGGPADGLTIRPLRMITGESHFNEVYLDGLHVPAGNVVGPVGDGWKVVRTTLMNERMAISGAAFDQGNDIRSTLAAADRHGLLDDGHWQSQLVNLYVDESVREILGHRSMERKLSGLPAGPEDSVNKILMARCNQTRTELNLDMAGLDGLLYATNAQSPADLTAYLRARANSIEGGTVEILHNVIAERVLGLPRDA